MRVEYDPEADAAYIYLREVELGGAKTQVPVIADEPAGEIILDLDEERRLIGIEILSAERGLPAELLRDAQRLPILVRLLVRLLNLRSRPPGQ